MRSARIFGLCLLPLPLSAQMHHVDKPERVTRAVGVYEWTGDLQKPDAARLIPVSIFINRHFEDAGVYLAQPIPLALQTGTVYSLQHAGDTFGSLDLDFARDVVDRRSVADDNPIGAWYGYGRFLPLSAEPKSNLTQRASAPAVIIGGDDDSQPHFVPSRNAAGGTTQTASTGAPNDSDRPTMARRGGSATDNAPSSPGTADIDNDPDRPTLGHRQAEPENKRHKKESGSGVEAMPTSLNDDPDRPELHRGKVASLSAPPQMTGLPADMHQVVAVSDAATNPPHDFARDWDSPQERPQTLAAMQKLADPIVRAYLAANHLTAAPAPSTGPKLLTPGSRSTTQANRTARTATHSATHSGTRSTAHHAPSPAAPLPLSQEQLTGYTLSYGGLPTFVYSAAVPTQGGLPIRVTVVAKRLPSGELQTSLSSVTDEAHLDRTPWMRLVDAVDPDDSHRASLLFELRARASRQFALYSLASAQAEQTFVTGVIE